MTGGVQIVSYPHDIVRLQPEAQSWVYTALSRLDDLFAKYDWQIADRDADAKTFTIVAKMAEADNWTFMEDMRTWMSQLTVGLGEDGHYGATMLFDNLIGLFCFPADPGTLARTGIMRAVFNYQQFGYLERRKARFHQDNYRKQKVTTS